MAKISVYKALADPTRRRILHLLRKQGMTAGELAEHFEITKPTLSRHFAILKEADLIYGEKKATTITYFLNTTVLQEVITALMNSLDISLSGGEQDDGE
ncbi:MAG: winged helix-turn-helix transcriptional regulator [Planctomycetes bacterium]|nr:winged helix-turn-helix transcriptional regulator [Planctomycetota bacterium]